VMENLRALLRRVGRTDATVLIQGESGTGKELVARALYKESPRSGAPFIKLNCAAITESLIESEFFGHEKGAFTGALAKREGRFELAHGGTLLLDEISEISPAVQAKLLRVLQEREFERVGGTRTIKVNVRVIATTNRQLELSVERKEFRQDLFFRLNVVPIHVPPLREHRDDVGFLANHFMQRFARKHGVRVKGLSDECLRALDHHAWPGNVRELQNVIERAVILSDDGAWIEPEHCCLPVLAHPVAVGDLAASVTPVTDAAAPATPDASPVTLHELEKRHIFSTLERCHNNRTQAARVLDISVRTLRNKLHEYGATAALPAEGEAEDATAPGLADGNGG
jgi:DNA-binding NtrC family response regulator